MQTHDGDIGGVVIRAFVCLTDQVLKWYWSLLLVFCTLAFYNAGLWKSAFRTEASGSHAFDTSMAFVHDVHNIDNDAKMIERMWDSDWEFCWACV